MTRAVERFLTRAAQAAVFAGLLATAACSPQLTSSPAPADTSVLFADDFSNVNSGWDRHSDRATTADYEDAHYLISVEQTGVDVWGRPGLELAGAVIEADATMVSGPAQNEYGLLCRLTQRGGQNDFYFFLITSNGRYAAGKVVKNRRTVLAPTAGSFQPSPAINLAPGAVNHLQAACAGGHMQFAVNGTPVAEFEDGDLAQGDIGLVAGTFGEGGVRVQFDNVLVRRP